MTAVWGCTKDLSQLTLGLMVLLVICAHRLVKPDLGSVSSAPGR